MSLKIEKYIKISSENEIQKHIKKSNNLFICFTINIIMSILFFTSMYFVLNSYEHFSALRDTIIDKYELSNNLMSTIDYTLVSISDHKLLTDSYIPFKTSTIMAFIASICLILSNSFFLMNSKNGLLSKNTSLSYSAKEIFEVINVLCGICFIALTFSTLAVTFTDGYLTIFGFLFSSFMSIMSGIIFLCICCDYKDNKLNKKYQRCEASKYMELEKKLRKDIVSDNALMESALDFFNENELEENEERQLNKLFNQYKENVKNEEIKRKMAAAMIEERRISKEKKKKEYSELLKVNKSHNELKNHVLMDIENI